VIGSPGRGNAQEKQPTVFGRKKHSIERHIEFYRVSEFFTLSGISEPGG
jgi:hypothetical protein